MSHLYPDNWIYYLNAIQSNVEIEDKRRKQLVKSLIILRRNLGEDWLSKSKDMNHPILWSVRILSSGYADNLLSIWTDSMSILEGFSGFDKILSRIKKTDSFESAISELEVASRLVKYGCNLKIESEIKDKKPDFFCKKDRCEFFVEVKTLATANETKKARKTSRQIIAACNPLFPTGIMLKPLSDPHLKEVESILREKTKYVVDKKTDAEVDIPNVLKLYLVSDESSERIEKYRRWHRKQEDLGIIPNGSGGLRGPPDNVKQDYRAIIRINKFAKKKQIPTDKIGILVLVGNFSFWSINVENFVDVIIEEVYGLSNIPAVILISTKAFSDGKSNVIEKEHFVLINNYLHGNIKEEILIIKNRFCKFKFDYDILKNIFFEI